MLLGVTGGIAAYKSAVLARLKATGGQPDERTRRRRGILEVRDGPALPDRARHVAVQDELDEQRLRHPGLRRGAADLSCDERPRDPPPGRPVAPGQRARCEHVYAVRNETRTPGRA